MSKYPVQFYEAPTQVPESLTQPSSFNKVGMGWGNLKYLLPL